MKTHHGRLTNQQKRDADTNWTRSEELDQAPAAPRCRVNGCSGAFGPGCMVSPPDTLYFRCENNARMLRRIWEALEEKP